MYRSNEAQSMAWNDAELETTKTSTATIHIILAELTVMLVRKLKDRITRRAIPTHMSDTTMLATNMLANVCKDLNLMSTVKRKELAITHHRPMTY